MSSYKITLPLLVKCENVLRFSCSLSINDSDFSNKKSEQCSPKNVLDLSEGDYQSTEEDSSSHEGSTLTDSPPPPLALELKGRYSFRKHMSSLKQISSFFRFPFEQGTRKQEVNLPVKEQPPPLFKCFSYEELAIATNNFHEGTRYMGIGTNLYKNT